MQKRVDVLDKGYLEVINHMGDDAFVVNCIRASFDKQITELQEKDERLLKRVIDEGHVSTQYHAQVSFRWKAPISVHRQLERHRVGTSMSSQSTRYSEIEEDQFYIPERMRQQSKNNKQGSSDAAYPPKMEIGLQNAYTYSCLRSYSEYQNLLKAGVAKELAREILPLCTYTTFIWTASLAAIVHFIKLRDEEHSQFEIRQYAKAMRELITPLFPVSVKYLLGEKVEYPPKITNDGYTIPSDELHNPLPLE